jgi:hypothetical protein
LQRGGKECGSYLTLQRSQGTGLTTNGLKRTTIRYSGRSKENHGGDTVRRLKRLQNVPNYIGSTPRKGGVQLAPFNLIMESILRQRGKSSRNYFEYTFLALRLFWNLLEVGTVLNWNFRYGKYPGMTGRSPKWLSVMIG